MAAASAAGPAAVTTRQRQAPAAGQPDPHAHPGDRPGVLRSAGAVACVLTGPASREQLNDNLARAARDVPSGVWARLRAEGLLPADVPVPDASVPASGGTP